MSTYVPLVAPKGQQRKHRHTRSAAASEPSTASHPRNSHHINTNAYSDNTQASVQQFHPSTPPRTPKVYQKSMGSAATDGSAKPRSKAKNKPKNVITSPQVPQSERITPPLSGVAVGATAKGIKDIPTPTAYAGPTFHASPAPSALPIPSFYSKSVPESPAPALQSMKEETSSDSSNSPTPPTSQSTSEFQREESPLDFFFKKDRAEKARARGSSSASGPFQPPGDSPHSINTPVPNQDRSRSGHFTGGSGSRMFAMELDGTNTPGKPYGPAFSTPYSQRMDAARSVTASSPNAGRGLDDARDIQKKSQALNDFLFTGQSPRSPAVQNNTSANSSPYSPTPPNFRVTPTASSPANGQRSVGLSSRTFQGYGDFAYLNNSTPSISRSSGLRQEVSHTVTPTKTLERISGYQNTLAPSRVAGNNFPAVSSGHNQFFATGHSGSPHSTPPPQRSADLQGMEDSLRRILKLDSSSGSLGGTGGIGHLPAASSSVPNYVGGRAPPMNGMHNGVMGS